MRSVHQRVALTWFNRMIELTTTFRLSNAKVQNPIGKCHRDVYDGGSFCLCGLRNPILDATF